jgi:hypothetical protein
LERGSGKEQGSADVGSNVLAEILETIRSSQWAVFPIVGFIDDKKREVTQNAPMGCQAVNVYKLSLHGTESILAVTEKWLGQFAAVCK